MSFEEMKIPLEAFHLEPVRERVVRVSGLLSRSGVPWALIGGNCVAAWVSQRNLEAVRPTRDVDILIDRKDLVPACAIMSNNGFVFRKSAGMSMFLDGPGGKARDAVHILFAGEKVMEKDLLPAPGLSEVSAFGDVRLMSIPGLLQMKLLANRPKDAMHILDLDRVGMIDQDVIGKVPTVLVTRLNEILASGWR